MLKLKIIIGSIREGRSADLVAPWVIDRAKNHGAFEVEVLDLVEWKLPLFAETVQSWETRRTPPTRPRSSRAGTSASRTATSTCS